MRRFLERVTISGADDAVHQNDMRAIQGRFPFVEWGILLSKSAEGKRERFPSLEWMRTLVVDDENGSGALRLSGHLCAGWARHAIKGKPTFWDDRPEICGCFDRFQVNFAAFTEQFRAEPFFEMLTEDRLQHKQIILQLKDLSDGILMEAQSITKVLGFFDLSGGHGVLPSHWPIVESYCGFGGGLRPENLHQQLQTMSRGCRSPIWIDTESGVRTDGLLDLDKVVRFLEIAKPWVLIDEGDGTS